MGVCSNNKQQQLRPFGRYGKISNLGPWPGRTDLAITQSMRQGLSLRFSRDDYTLAHSFFESFLVKETGLNMSSSTAGPAESTLCSSNFLRYLLLNTKSLRNEINDLSALLLRESFDIVSLAETWLIVILSFTPQITWVQNYSGFKIPSGAVYYG